MVLRDKKAQSTLEYVIVLTAIVGVIIWAGATLVQPKMKQAFTDIKTTVESTASAVSP